MLYRSHQRRPYFHLTVCTLLATIGSSCAALTPRQALVDVDLPNPQPTVHVVYQQEGDGQMILKKGNRVTIPLAGKDVLVTITAEGYQPHQARIAGHRLEGRDLGRVIGGPIIWTLLAGAYGIAVGLLVDAVTGNRGVGVLTGTILGTVPIPLAYLIFEGLQGDAQAHTRVRVKLQPVSARPSAAPTAGSPLISKPAGLPLMGNK
jgi:hypothetical protein